MRDNGLNVAIFLVTFHITPSSFSGLTGESKWLLFLNPSLLNLFGSRIPRVFTQLGQSRGQAGRDAGGMVRGDAGTFLKMREAGGGRRSRCRYFGSPA